MFGGICPIPGADRRQPRGFGGTGEDLQSKLADLLDTFAIRPFVLERKSLSRGDVLALWYPRTKSIAGVAPTSGLLTGRPQMEEENSRRR
jgi:hypothetical protein